LFSPSFVRDMMLPSLQLAEQPLRAPRREGNTNVSLEE
jgi:hypothetical protein